MPARKRKAPAPKLAAISEATPPRDAPQEEEEARDAAGRTKEEALAFIQDQVTERMQALLATGRELAAAVRAQSQLACIRIPKKVREMSVAEFFQLSEQEAQQTTLLDLGARLTSMGVAPAAPARGGGAGVAAAAPAAPATAAPATRTTRRTAARTGADATQHVELAPPATTRRATRTTGAGAAAAAAAAPVAPAAAAAAPTQGEGGALGVAEAAAAAPASVLRDRTNTMHASSPPAHALMPPPKCRGGSKQQQQQEQQQPASENEAAPQGTVAGTPHRGHCAPSVAATPAAANGGLLASASQLMGSTMRALPGGTSLMAGFTLMKRTVARGRTRRPQDDSAIMITVADGRQFMVDMGTGLANVPDTYRGEVSAQLEVMHRLAGAALNIRR